MTIQVKRLDGWKKIIGLMGAKKIKPIYFKTRWGIHTFGVIKPIDIVILDDTNRVAKIKQNLKPNRIFIWNIRYEHVVELPKGTIEKERIKIGENIKLEFPNS